MPVSIGSRHRMRVAPRLVGLALIAAGESTK